MVSVIVDTTSKVKVRATIDSRMVLLTSLEILSDSRDVGFCGCSKPGPAALTEFDIPYKSRFVKHFLMYKNDPIVKVFEQLVSNQNFYLDKWSNLMFHLTKPPELEVAVPLPKEFEQRFGDKENLQEFIHLLRNFAAATGFCSFFESHSDMFRKIEANTEEQLTRYGVIDALENYYGIKQHSYTLLIEPLFRKWGGNGFRMECHGGSYDAYAIIGSTGVKDGIPVVEGLSLVNTSIHEFSHHFVEPITESVKEKISDMAMGHKSTPIPEGYNTFYSVVIENIIRAIEIRLVASMAETDSVSREKFVIEELKQLEQRGFIFVTKINKKLEEYESKRKEYHTFAEFYPLILKVFEDYNTT